MRNTNFIRERTIGRSRCRLERIVKRGKTDYSPFSADLAFQRLSVFCHQGLSLCCLCCSKVIARIELNALKLRVKWNQNVKNKLKFQIKMKRKMRRKRQNAESKRRVAHQRKIDQYGECTKTFKINSDAFPPLPKTIYW